MPDPLTGIKVDTTLAATYRAVHRLAAAVDGLNAVLDDAAAQVALPTPAPEVTR